MGVRRLRLNAVDRIEWAGIVREAEALRGPSSRERVRQKKCFDFFLSLSLSLIFSFHRLSTM
jgi:hypothetical protein